MSDAFQLFNEGVSASLQAHAHRSEGRFDAAARCDQEAIQFFDQTLELEPTHTGALGGKAMSLASLGRTQDSIASFEAALAIEPNPEFLRQLGLCYVELGNMEQAWIVTRQAMALEDTREYRQNASAELVGFGNHVLRLLEAHQHSMSDEQIRSYYQWAASIYALAYDTDSQNLEAKSLLTTAERNLERLSSEE